MNWTRTLVPALLGSLLLSGCSLVPTTSSPVLVNPHEVPFGLLNATVPGTANGRVRFVTQPVYIVDATGHLTPSSRIVPAPPRLASVLHELIIGPTAIEVSTGYSSALPSNAVVVDASVRGHVGYIDLARPLTNLARHADILATGQLVLTSYGVGATKGIEIFVAGVLQKSLVPGGSPSALVNVKDYQILLNG